MLAESLKSRHKNKTRRLQTKISNSKIISLKGIVIVRLKISKQIVKTRRVEITLLIVLLILKIVKTITIGKAMVNSLLQVM